MKNISIACRAAAVAAIQAGLTGLADQVKPLNPKAERGLLALTLKYDSESILKAVPERKP